MEIRLGFDLLDHRRPTTLCFLQISFTTTSTEQANLRRTMVFFTHLYHVISSLLKSTRLAPSPHS